MEAAMTQALERHIGTVGTSPSVEMPSERTATVPEKDFGGLAARLLKQARATSRTPDNAWMDDEMQSRLHSAAIALSRKIAERGGARFVSFAVFSDQEDGQGELVADCLLTGKRLMVTVRMEDARVQVVKATSSSVHRSDWQRQPYDLSEPAAWLLNRNA